MTQEKQVIITSILDASNIIKSFDIEKDLVREIELGTTLNFAAIREPLNKIKEFVDKVLNCQLAEMPFELLNEYKNILQRILDFINSIKSFKIDTNNPIGSRNHLINGLAQCYETLIEPAMKLIAYDSAIDISKASVESINNRINNATQVINNNIELSQERLAELNGILESAKSAAGEVGVTVHATLFEKESAFHKKEAGKWLRNVVIVIVLIIVGGLAALKMMPAFDNAAYLIQYSVTKVVVIATMFYALSICMKNYRAHKHNEIVNKHRQNALSTFETFVNSSAEQQTKDAVLLQATMSIFSNQQTGYSSSDNDGDMPSKVIEIIKSAAPATKG